MNSQERDALTSFLQQMCQAQTGQKDPEAEALIKSAMDKQPDAGYLLVQRAMQFDLLLQQAQIKMTEMQTELDRLKKPAETSFLGDIHAWGRGSSQGAATTSSSAASTPGMVPSASATGAPPVNQTLRASAAGAPATAAQPAPAAAPSTWGSGLLGSVATTAAGVVAGSFLYHGIQNLMGNHASSSAGSASNAMGNAQNDWRPPENANAGAVYTAYVDSPMDSNDDFGMDDGGDDGDGGGGGDGE